MSNDLKINGEKIILDFDNCEIKENNYYNDITNRGFYRSDIANSGYTEEYIEKSVIFYTHKNGAITEKYISQVFPINTITLGSRILNNEIELYVDRFDRSKYMFEYVPKIKQTEEE